MSGLNRPENYAGRVAYAAQVIIKGRTPTRAFDNCFENDDGDEVSAALVRRAAKNPKLAANLNRYINRQMAEEAAARLAGRNLAQAAREARERKQAERGQ
jgi:hypothetical protein